MWALRRVGSSHYESPMRSQVSPGSQHTGYCLDRTPFHIKQGPYHSCYASLVPSQFLQVAPGQSPRDPEICFSFKEGGWESHPPHLYPKGVPCSAFCADSPTPQTPPIPKDCSGTPLLIHLATATTVSAHQEHPLPFKIQLQTLPLSLHQPLKKSRWGLWI